MAIYARLEDGTYAEVTGVYKTDGTEVTEIFQGDRLVYSATNEIYGTVPLYYNGLGYELIDYLISGNAVQDGTPSPEAPVDVVGCGVRTAQLIDISTANTIGATITQIPTGMRIETTSSGYGAKITLLVEPNTDYTIKYTFDNVQSGANRVTVFAGTTASTTLATFNYNSGGTFNTGNNTTINIWFYAAFSSAAIVEYTNIMLNLGSTALPYEPYGYKLPLTVNGVEYPIYLGEVETTRRVKKLVLTGNESFGFDDASGTKVVRVPDHLELAGIAGCLCSHYIAAQNTTGGYFTLPDLHCAMRAINSQFWIRDTSLSPDAFKSYLAAQYANGTPVTVWYVLATEETAIVNEPLMKIGDYADTISFDQAEVTIPTVSGENILDMTSPVKPSEIYIKGKGIKPTGYGQLTDVNGVNILDKDGNAILVHGQ